MVVATSNRSLDELLCQWFAIATDIGKAFQIVTGGKANHFARRSIFQIPKVGFEAVGVKAERQLAAQLLLNVVAILLGLLAAYGCVPAGLFGFDNGQWLAIFTQQDVVAELSTLIRSPQFIHALRQARQDVEFFDDLCGVFDIPAR